MMTSYDAWGGAVRACAVLHLGRLRACFRGADGMKGLRRSARKPMHSLRQNRSGNHAGRAVVLFWGLVAFCPVPWAVTPAVAATITVNDTSGGTGGPGCKLRDAITAGNTDGVSGGCSAGSGADIIVLPTNATITLTGADNSTDGANGLPSITTTITIQGNGATTAAVSPIAARAR